MKFTDTQVFGVLITERKYWEQRVKSAKYKKDWREGLWAEAGLKACRDVLKRFEALESELEVRTVLKEPE